jgi:hypothetical protein
VGRSIVCRDLDRLELPVYAVKGHDSIINSIDGVGGLGIGGGAPEIVTGSRDGGYHMLPLNVQQQLLHH